MALEEDRTRRRAFAERGGAYGPAPADSELEAALSSGDAEGVQTALRSFSHEMGTVIEALQVIAD